MSRTLLFVSLLLLTAGAVLADVPESERTADAAQARVQDEAPEPEQAGDAADAQAQTKEGAKMISGMSILGNQEAPKSLVIVPWKSSELGDAVGISTMLDDSKRPVDREVFLRELSYYEIRSKTTISGSN